MLKAIISLHIAILLHKYKQSSIIHTYMMNSQDFTGGNSDQLDGFDNLCRRGDEVIEYIFTESAA